jgi:hypothetical protein
LRSSSDVEGCREKIRPGSWDANVDQLLPLLEPLEGEFCLDDHHAYPEHHDLHVLHVP